MKSLAMFTRQLASMLRGGLTLVASLKQLATVFPHKGYSRAAGEMALGLTMGYGFSQQLGNYPRLFPAFYRGVTEIGETGDSLLPALDTLAHYYREREVVKNRLLRILFYPLLLIIVALGSGMIALWYVVPGFSSLYAVLGARVPAATSWVFALAEAVTPTRMLLAGIGLAAVFAGGCRFLAKRVRWRTLAKLPLVGTLYCYWFCLVTAMITQAGHTLEQALTMAAAVSRRGPGPAALEAIREGRSLYSGLEGSPGVLRSFVAQGEATGELPEALARATEYYRQGLEDVMENFQRLLEPVSVLIVGGMVAAMLLVLMLPVLQLARVF
ncbi:MAG: type II secretion system F family protein [Bacillota bacterium]|jgi:type II secretory pathway component PulF|nr:type II secretion system F family protein [Bacillota bacterium]HPZ21455.1 type II secretion system F family protein [Bacillota bacterium]HQD19317.1 type II secretion system F family protein [Bacillota bacterium]